MRIVEILVTESTKITIFLSIADLDLFSCQRSCCQVREFIGTGLLFSKY